MGDFFATYENLPAWMQVGSAANMSIVSFERDKWALGLSNALQVAKNHEVAVKPSAEGFAKGEGELFYWQILRIAMDRGKDMQ